MNSEHCSGRKPSYVPPFAVAGFCRTPLLGLDGKIGSANPAIIPAIPLAPFPKTVPYRRQSGSPFPVLASQTMKVVSTFHHPSAVSCSTRCKFPPDDREYLVVGKTNHLELYSLQPNGLHLESTLDVWGHIVTIRPVEFTVGSSLAERPAQPNFQISDRTQRRRSFSSSPITPSRSSYCCRADSQKTADQLCGRTTGRAYTKLGPNHLKN